MGTKLKGTDYKETEDPGYTKSSKRPESISRGAKMLFSTTLSQRPGGCGDLPDPYGSRARFTTTREPASRGRAALTGQAPTEPSFT